MNDQPRPAVPPARSLRERFERAIGCAKHVRRAGTLECYVRTTEPDGVYVLDTSTGIVFHEPMPAQPACAGGQRLLPTDWRLLERLVRLLCSMDDPLTLEDAYARMGDEVAQMVVGIEPESELFDLTGPGGGLPLLSLPERVSIVKHPVLPVFAVGVPVLQAVGGSDRTRLAVLRP